MSTHLLRTTVGGRTRFSSKTINNGATSTTDYAFFTCEYDRVVYSMWRRDASPVQFHISKFNLQSGVTTYIGYITASQVGYTDMFGGWLCDGEYMYFSIPNGTGKLVKIKLSDYSKTVYESTTTYTCWGRCQWYDDHTIAIMDQLGIAFFDTKTNTWSHMHYKPSATSNCNQFVITDKLIANTSRNTGAAFAWYNKQTEEYHTVSLPVSDYPCELCYGDGKFYVVNKAYIFIFDEETEEWEEEYIPVQFTTAGGNYPAEIRYCLYAEGVVYIIVEGSNRLWAYDPDTKHVTYKILPWTIPGYDTGNTGRNDYRNRQCILTPFHRYMFIQCYSFAYFNYEGLYKYNMGYKYLQYVINCGEDTIDYNEKDPCLIPKSTYLTFEAVPVILQPETWIPQTTIKSISVNKRDYKEIYNINMI